MPFPWQNILPLSSRKKKYCNFPKQKCFPPPQNNESNPLLLLLYFSLAQLEKGLLQEAWWSYCYYYY